LSYQDDYSNERRNDWKAAGDLEEGRLYGYEAVLNTPQSYNPRPNRKAGSFSRHATLAVILILFSTTRVLAYYNPEFRQSAVEVISKAASKFTSFIETDYSQKTGQALIARGNALRVKKQYAEAEDAYQGAIGKFTIKEDNRGLGNAFTELGF